MSSFKDFFQRLFGRKRKRDPEPTVVPNYPAPTAITEPDKVLTIPVPAPPVTYIRTSGMNETPTTATYSTSETIVEKPIPNEEWKKFKYANPLTDFEKNFNFLADIDFKLAFAYMMHPIQVEQVPPANNRVTEDLGYNLGNAVANAFIPPGTMIGSVAGNSIGVNFDCPRINFEWNNGDTYIVDWTGNSDITKGKRFILPCPLKKPNKLWWE